MNVYDDFKTVWKRFEELSHGKLIEKSKQSALTAAAARTAVSAAASVWTDKYDPCGKWLGELRREDAKKASRILEIVENIDFIDAPPAKKLSDLSVVGISVLGAVVGAGVSSQVFHTGTLVSAAYAILPAAALYPIMKKTQSEVYRSEEKRVIGEYMEQLDSVRGLILEVLDD